MPKPKNKLHAKKVDRIAFVDDPAVPDAEIVAFKRRDNKEDVINKSVTAYQDLPMTSARIGWSSRTAELRVRNWATDSEGNMDWAKYRKAFMWYDEKEVALFGSYRLPYADIVHGELKAIPRAIIAIVQVLSGARGGVNIPRADKEAILDQLKKYYAKMDMEMPDVIIKAIEKNSEEAIWKQVLYSSIVTTFDDFYGSVHVLEDQPTGDKTPSTTIQEAFLQAYDVFTGTVVFHVSGMFNLELLKQEKNAQTQKNLVDFVYDMPESYSLEQTEFYVKTVLPAIVLMCVSLKINKDNTLKIVKEFLDHVKSRVENLIDKFVSKDGIEDFHVFDKAGRVISAARLRKMRDAVNVLTALIDEATERYSIQDKGAVDVELKELIEKVSTIAESVDTLQQSHNSVIDILKKQNLVLTDEEKAKVEAEKADTEKKEQEELEKRKKDDEDKEGAIAKEKEALNKRLDQIESSNKEVSTLLTSVSKRFGIKTSLDQDTEKVDKRKGTADFRKMLKKDFTKK